MKKTPWGIAISTLAILWCVPALADDTIDALLGLSLEGLMDQEVTSVSKKKEKLSETAAAAYVITQEDIRRSGMTSIPELLRMVPGVHVTRIDSNQWAITARGFNSEFANKLLVLIDGRSVYTPLFSGVFWDEQDLMLEDVERIEVVRGPGGTIWGANAVNGVINIITKHARDTQGDLATVTTGNQERATVAARHGGKTKDGNYRVYAKYLDRGGEQVRGGGDADDDWHMGRAGFRSDWERETDSFTLQGDAFNANEDRTSMFSTVTPPYRTFLPGQTTDVQGGNILGRWNRNTDDGQELTLQAYADHSARDYHMHGHRIDTVDVDFQHTLPLAERHELTWGTGWRRIWSETDTKNTLGIDYVRFTPESQADDLASAFVQDKITLMPDTLALTLGSKFEHNDYTGYEVQPNARLLWTPDARHSVWGSVSRAVRVPGRSETVDVMIEGFPPNTVLPSPLPVFAYWVGNPAVEAENLLAYEIGTRAELDNHVTLDATVFYNDYSNLLATEVGAPVPVATPSPYLRVPLDFDNNMYGESYGTEIAASWRVTPEWNLAASYSLLQLYFHKKPGSTTTLPAEDEIKYPQQQFSLRSYLTLPHDMELDTSLYYVDDVKYYTASDYIRADLRLGWKPCDGLELSLVGQNLLDDRHSEFGPSIYVAPIEVGRSFYGKATWRF
ncbi:MAG: TonB-dependent receptor [Alphaproteobacteria bacterium]|nr:TonB-dependent receptor [Alphaproteobacteria bacterium]